MFIICLAKSADNWCFICHSSLYSLSIGRLLHCHGLSFSRESKGVGHRGSRLDQGRETSKKEQRSKKYDTNSKCNTGVLSLYQDKCRVFSGIWKYIGLQKVNVYLCCGNYELCYC